MVPRMPLERNYNQNTTHHNTPNMTTTHYSTAHYNTPQPMTHHSRPQHTPSHDISPHPMKTQHTVVHLIRAQDTVARHSTTHHNTSHTIADHNTTQQTTPHHTTPHHFTPHETTPHHNTAHHSTAHLQLANGAFSLCWRCKTKCTRETNKGTPSHTAERPTPPDLWQAPPHPCEKHVMKGKTSPPSNQGLKGGQPHNACAYFKVCVCVCMFAWEHI